MFNFIKSDSGTQYIQNKEGFFELIFLSDLVYKEESPLNNFLFLKNTEERFRLYFSNEIRVFYKMPLFTKEIQRKNSVFGKTDKRAGAYIIMDYAEGRFYIGSSFSVSQRLHGHKKLLSKGTHFRKELQESFNKNGKNYFHVIYIVAKDKEDAVDLEQKILNLYKDDIRKYNVATDARYSGKDIKYDTDRREKRAKLSKEIWADPERRKKMSDTQKRLALNPERNEAVSKSLKQYYLDNPDAKKRNSEMNKRRFSDPEERQKQSERIKNYFSQPGAKEKYREAQKHRRIKFCIDGVFYDGYGEAGRQLNIDPATIKQRVNSGLDKWKNWNKLDEAGNIIEKETYTKEELRIRHKLKLKEYYSNPENRRAASERGKKAMSSEKVREEIARKSKFAKKVSINGAVYNSLGEASRKLNMPVWYIQNRINSKNEKYQDWYVLEEPKLTIGGNR